MLINFPIIRVVLNSSLINSSITSNWNWSTSIDVLVLQQFLSYSSYPHIPELAAKTLLVLGQITHGIVIHPSCHPRRLISISGYVFISCIPTWHSCRGVVDLNLCTWQESKSVLFDTWYTYIYIYICPKLPDRLCKCSSIHVICMYMIFMYIYIYI